jgi:hypothetical protein
MSDNIFLVAIAIVMVPAWFVCVVNQFLMAKHRKPGVSRFWNYFAFEPYLLTEPGLRARKRFFLAAAVFVATPFVGLLISKIIFH